MQEQATPQITLSRYRFIYQMESDAQLPQWQGSMWRGALGHALKATVCITRQKSCTGCSLLSACAYSELFETRPPADSSKMRRYNQVPHPYILHEYRPLEAGRYALGVTLVGRGNRYFPYLLHALDKAGQRGLTRRKVVMRLREVHQEWPPASGCWQPVYASGQPLEVKNAHLPDIPPPPEALNIRLETPLRLRRDGRLVTPENFRFADLYVALLRRISMLSYFHCATEYETDFAGMKQLALDIELSDRNLWWKAQQRYSSRQHTRMNSDGLLGSFLIEGQNIQAFWPVLWLGQWVHAGKLSTMGLGRYRMDTAASLPEKTPPAVNIHNG